MNSYGIVSRIIWHSNQTPLISVISILVFTGVYLWYSTTKRINIRSEFGNEFWSQKNPLFSKTIGAIMFFLAGWIAVDNLGIGAGTLSLLIIAINISCLVILCAPLGLLNRYSFITLAATAIIIEIFIL